jgi:DNA-binding NtrC family response regulator
MKTVERGPGRAGEEEELRRGAEAVAKRLGVEPIALTFGYVERHHAFYVVRVCEGNLSLAARVLGIYRRTLQRKLIGWRRKPVLHFVEPRQKYKPKTMRDKTKRGRHGD